MTELVLWWGAFQVVAAVVLGLAWALDLTLRRRSAATRRGVWALAIAVVLVLPFTRIVLAAPAFALPAPAASLALAIWLLGAATLGARASFGALTARRWARDAHLVEAREWRDDLAALARAPVQLRATAAIDAPLALGIWRAVILVPESMLRVPAEMRRSILAHELAHVARGDCALLTAGALVRAIGWLDPLSWIALSRLRALAENAADDAVLASGVRSSSYAAQLVGLAQARAERTARGGVSAGLRDRVFAILDVDRPRSAALPGTMGARGGRLVAAAVALATMVTACEARSEVGVDHCSSCVTQPSPCTPSVRDHDGPKETKFTLVGGATPPPRGLW